jgi:hypothetical protein
MSMAEGANGDAFLEKQFSITSTLDKEGDNG